MKTYENPKLCRDQRYDGITRPIVIMRVCDSYMIQRFNNPTWHLNETSKMKKYKLVPTAFGENL